MPDAYPQAQPDPAVEILNHLRDLEEKQRLLRDRVVLLGNTLVDDRDKTFKEIQEMKKDVIKLKEDSQRIKDLTQRMAEQIGNFARKEEVMMLQRQLDLIREA